MRNIVVLAALASSACAAQPAEVPVRGASDYACRGDDLARFVGQPAS